MELGLRLTVAGQQTVLECRIYMERAYRICHIYVWLEDHLISRRFCIVLLVAFLFYGIFCSSSFICSLVSTAFGLRTGYVQHPEQDMAGRRQDMVYFVYI